MFAVFLADSMTLGGRMRSRRTISRIEWLPGPSAFRPSVFLSFAVALFIALVSPATCRPQTVAKKIVIDTDPGTDDALAILLALNSPEVDVRAITIVAGNVTADLGLETLSK